MTLHNANLDPIVQRAALSLTRLNSKIRRGGYRAPRRSRRRSAGSHRRATRAPTYLKCRRYT